MLLPTLTDGCYDVTVKVMIVHAYCTVYSAAGRVCVVVGHMLFWFNSNQIFTVSLPHFNNDSFEKSFVKHA